MLVAVLVLLTLVGAVLLCRRDTWVWPAVLVALCGLWLLVNKPLEGPVLLVVSRGHGITLSDLLAPALVAFAAAVLYRRLVRQSAKPTPNQATRNQPTRNQPTRNQPTRNQPTRNQTTGSQPTPHQSTRDYRSED